MHGMLHAVKDLTDVNGLPTSMGSQSYNLVFGATGSAYDPAPTAGGINANTAIIFGPNEEKEQL